MSFFFGGGAQIENLVARKIPNNNQHGRINATQVEIKK
jgi:hypothetical protein